MSTQWPYVPAAPARPASAANRQIPIGIVSLVLALAELGYFGYKLIAALAVSLLDQAQRALLPGAVPAVLSSAFGRATETFRDLAVSEMESLIPCAVLALALGIIAIFLLAGRAGGLGAARIWCGVALLAVGVTVALQLLVLMPQLSEIERWVDGHVALSHGHASVVLPTMLKLLAHDALLAVWPFALFLWAGHVRGGSQPSDRLA